MEDRNETREGTRLPKSGTATRENARYAMSNGELMLNAYLTFSLVGVPLFGNLVPSRVSFLSSMRYYAGNWAYSIWLFKGDSWKKLDDNLTKASPGLRAQLEGMLDEEALVAVARAPKFVRKMAVGNVEDFAEEHGLDRVTLDTVKAQAEAAVRYAAIHAGFQVPPVWRFFHSAFIYP